MKKKVVIGVLAYNVERYIEDVLNELIKINEKIFIIDDCSSDNTVEIIKKYEKEFSINLIENHKNIGAGASTKKLIDIAKNSGYEMLIKVDGDGQFKKEDISKIVHLTKNTNYKFIKCNRFWKGGITGKIPKKRFFGNLLATIFLQFTTGTNKIFDPLNGLFGVSTSILEHLDTKNYPNRYGYPYYISLAAIINEFETIQINNVIDYKDQKSKLNSFNVLLIIIKLSIIFYFKKIKLKKSIGVYQRSAFLDLCFIFIFLINLSMIFQLFYITFFANTSIINAGNLLFLIIFFTLIDLIIFISSFKEERNIRNTYVDVEN